MPAADLILTGRQTPSFLRHPEPVIQIHKVDRSLGTLCGQRMSDSVPHPSPSGILLCIGKVNTVSLIRHLITLFRILLDRDSNLIQTSLSSHASGPGSQCAAYSFGGVDPAPLTARKDLYKRCSVCSRER